MNTDHRKRYQRIAWGDILKARDMKERGMSDNLIGKAIGRSGKSVSNMLSSYRGCATLAEFEGMHKRKGTKTSIIRNGTIAKYILAHEDETIAQIAAACGVGVSTVKFVLDNI